MIDDWVPRRTVADLSASGISLVKARDIGLMHDCSLRALQLPRHAHPSIPIPRLPRSFLAPQPDEWPTVSGIGSFANDYLNIVCVLREPREMRDLLVVGACRSIHQRCRRMSSLLLGRHSQCLLGRCVAGIALARVGLSHTSPTFRAPRARVLATDRRRSVPSAPTDCSLYASPCTMSTPFRC